MTVAGIARLLGTAIVFAGSSVSAEFVKSTPCVDCTVAPATSDHALYSQLDDPSGQAFTDQQFEAAYTAYDSEGADDFEVHDAEGWDLTTLETPGGYPYGNHFAADYMNHFFYADAGGLPGAVLDGCSFPLNDDFVDQFGHLFVNVTGCSVGAGVHWFSQQVRKDSQGQHYWDTRLSANGHEAVWRNPGDAFGTGCVEWSPANAACGMLGTDYLFELLGTRGSEPDPVPAVGALGVIVLVLAMGGAILLRRQSLDSMGPGSDGASGRASLFR